MRVLLPLVVTGLTALLAAAAPGPGPQSQPSNSYAVDYEDDYYDDYYDQEYPDPPPEEPKNPSTGEQEKTAPASTGTGVEPVVQEHTHQRPDGVPDWRHRPPSPAEQEVRTDGPVLRTGGGGTGGGDGGVVPAPAPGRPLTDAEAERLLQQFSHQERQACRARLDDIYQFYIQDQTTGPQKAKSDAEYNHLWRTLYEDASALDLTALEQTSVLEKFVVLRHPGFTALDDSGLKALSEEKTNLETLFARARVCDFFNPQNCTLDLYRNVRVKLAASRSTEELMHYWSSWRDQLARTSATMYSSYIQLIDRAAKTHNSNADAWTDQLYPYSRGGASRLPADLESVWEEQIAPIYWQLHQFTRYRLRQHYGQEAVPETGPIPAHLLGSLEADDWTGLQQLLLPINNVSGLNFHERCSSRNVRVGDLVDKVGELFSGVGLGRVSDQDLARSRLDVTDRRASTVLLLPRVIEECDGSVFQCAAGIFPTNTTVSDFIELVELYAAMMRPAVRDRTPAAQQPSFVYKDRDNFRDYGLELAVGGSRALSAISPAGLHSVLGINFGVVSDEQLINFQIVYALKLLPRLAASMAALQWQKGVMEGVIKQENYNKKWWELKDIYQGVAPPTERDENKFDPLADGTILIPNYHMRRLVGGIAMFSIHEQQCRLYGDRDQPLSRCAVLDQTKNMEIKELLISGTSKAFPDQLQSVTGHNKLSGASLALYLQPVNDWITEFNKHQGGDSGGLSGDTTTIIIVVVSVAVVLLVVIGLVCCLLARRRRQYKDYTGAPTRPPAGDVALSQQQRA